MRRDAPVRRFNFQGASQNHLDYTMGLTFNGNFVSVFAKMNGFIDFTRVHNFLLSSEYSVFNSTVTYILCAITPLLYNNNLIFRAFDAAVYFNNPLNGIAVTRSLSVGEVRVRLSSPSNLKQTVSPTVYHRCDISSCCVAHRPNRADEPRHSLRASTYYPEYRVIKL